MNFATFMLTMPECLDGSLCYDIVVANFPSKMWLGAAIRTSAASWLCIYAAVCIDDEGLIPPDQFMREYALCLLYAPFYLRVVRLPFVAFASALTCSRNSMLTASSDAHSRIAPLTLHDASVKLSFYIAVYWGCVLWDNAKEWRQTNILGSQ